MKQKNKLQDRIVQKYLIVIVSMSLFVLFAFNLSMRFYINKMALSEIAESRETVKVLLKDELKDIQNIDTLQPKVQEYAKAINRSFRLTELTSESEIALINAKGIVLLPKTDEMTDPMQKITADVSSKISSGVIADTYSINYNKQRYLVSFAAYNETALKNRAQYLVVVASQNEAITFLRRINFILIAIICMTTLLGTLLFRKLAKDITGPIGAVSDYAKAIASGDFKAMTTNVDTLEIEALFHDLNAMSQSLQNKEQMKVDFLQNFSHDLRTPLMSIQGYAEGIATGVFPEATKPATIIASESLRLKYLVDQLITLSRLDMSQKSIEFTNVNLYDFFTLLMSRYEGLAAKNAKKIVLNCTKELEILSNDDLLEKLFGNLLSNGIRYAESYVVIDVARFNATQVMTPSKNQRLNLIIRLQDDGPGIPESDLPHLFDRFYKGKEGNFGLGLAIAKTAATLLEFELKAENHPNGAIFIVEKAL